MRAYILTQEDAFYIPKLLTVFFAEKPASVQVVGAAILKGEIAPKNAGSYLKMLGPYAFLMNGSLYAAHRGLDVASRALPVPGGPYSVAGAFRKLGVPVDRPAKIGAPEFHAHLRALGVDLVISIACPQILRRDLLDLPPRGCINVHGALLPKYRGKMPSFWVLANGEKETGVTVHFMNEKLDDGPIIVQKRLPILPDDTLHSLVLRSKVTTGGYALAEAVAALEKGPVETMPNDSAAATIYSFPTPEAVARFRAHGRRFR